MLIDFLHAHLTKLKNGIGNKHWLGKAEVASEMNCKSSGELSLKAIPRRCTIYGWVEPENT